MFIARKAQILFKLYSTSCYIFIGLNSLVRCYPNLIIFLNPVFVGTFINKEILREGRNKHLLEPRSDAHNCTCKLYAPVFGRVPWVEFDRLVGVLRAA